MMVKIP